MNQCSQKLDRFSPWAVTDPRQKERVKAVLARLPLSQNLVPPIEFCIDFAASILCALIETAREEEVNRDDSLSSLIERRDRKPVAAVTTIVAAAVFQVLTDEGVTRVSKTQQEKRGQQETGRFAQFLKELFAVLQINASAAGQVKLFKSFARSEGRSEADRYYRKHVYYLGVGVSLVGARHY
jgi:hypothetical protein